MARSIWDVFRTLLRWNEETSEAARDAEDEGWFVPSPLDVSVRVSHGGSEDEIVRELSAVSEKARELEEGRRSN